jgi:hypothetical protein
MPSLCGAQAFPMDRLVPAMHQFHRRTGNLELSRAGAIECSDLMLERTGRPNTAWWSNRALPDQ